MSLALQIYLWKFIFLWNVCDQKNETHPLASHSWHKPMLPTIPRLGKPEDINLIWYVLWRCPDTTKSFWLLTAFQGEWGVPKSVFRELPLQSWIREKIKVQTLTECRVIRMIIAMIMRMIAMITLTMILMTLLRFECFTCIRSSCRETLGKSNQRTRSLPECKYAILPV